MELIKKSRLIILIVLGSILDLSIFNFTAFNFRVLYNDSSWEYNDGMNSEHRNLKISSISGIIHINNNWTDARVAGICTGNGTYSDPYIIEDLVINVNTTGSGILIENSNVFFKIENCTIYNSTGYKDAGIKLNNITNSRLVNNNCSSNYNAIYFLDCENNSVSENIVEINAEYGIILYNSNNNTVSENIVNNNLYGIELYSSDYNTISGNCADSNKVYGIHLSFSNYNL